MLRIVATVFPMMFTLLVFSAASVAAEPGDFASRVDALFKDYAQSLENYAGLLRRINDQTGAEEATSKAREIRADVARASAQYQ